VPRIFASRNALEPAVRIDGHRLPHSPLLDAWSQAIRGGASGGGLQINLDVNTLFRMTVYLEAILGLLLLFAWVQNITIRAVCSWGFAHLLRADR
jgi:hypothetical protein